MLLSSASLRMVMILAYAVVIVATITGLLKFSMKKSDGIRMVHKLTGPLLALLFTGIFFAAGLAPMRLIPRALLTGLFILIVYTALVTGKSDRQPWMLIAHRVTGGAVFVLFTTLLAVILIA
jgi:hypothetical protein